MMKVKKYIYGVAFGALALTCASCYNADHEFPDYEGGTTAYFAYQFPVRTLVLGNDIYDNTLDNEHKCQIWSTMGGAYGGRDAFVDIVVDESLCDNLFFTDDGGNPAAPVLPMPSAYYKLASNVIPYRGDPRGYVEVQFTDAFFSDPKSAENTYVIPLRMTGVKGIDHILTRGTGMAELEDLGNEMIRRDKASFKVRHQLFGSYTNRLNAFSLGIHSKDKAHVLLAHQCLECFHASRDIEVNEHSS